MKCCICEREISDYGNNPYPLCDQDDNESRCCDECNNFVIEARIQNMTKKKNPELNDFAIIFYSKNSSKPIETLSQTGKFLGGTIKHITYRGKEKIYNGTWGNFELSENDSFACLN